MRGKSIRRFLLPVLLAAGLGACANNAVQPGIVSTSGSSDRPGPTLGQDNDWVLGELLGLSADERKRLEADGALD